MTFMAWSKVTSYSVKTLSVPSTFGLGMMFFWYFAARYRRASLIVASFWKVTVRISFSEAGTDGAWTVAVAGASGAGATC